MAIEESDVELLTMFKALADESRLKIIGLLATRERSVDELATTLKLKPPTVSHHLATLREIGLVDMRAAGTTHVYNFQP
jgi:DNA-binding transcriptional ArsR family regulator